MESLTVEIVGLTPLLMHNGQLADPLNPYTKAMKPITSKRKKTDKDHADLAALEWEGGLYWDEANDCPTIPPENIEAAIHQAGGKNKSSLQLGVIVENVVFNYVGPRGKAALAADMRFRDRRGVVVSQSRVFRCRPRFNQWGATIEIRFDENEVNKETIITAIEEAGRRGICDYTPKFGRFQLKQ